MKADQLQEFYASGGVGQDFLLCGLQTRKPVLDYIAQQPAGYRVVDIGYAADGWTSNVVSCTVDRNPVQHARSGVEHFVIDIERETQWQALLQHVQQHGLFDFAICSHTIEDLHLPQVVLDMLPRIAHRGLIVVPSIYRELSPGNKIRAKQLSKGYDHHLWCFAEMNDSLLCIPKMSHLEHKDYRIDTSGACDELHIPWRGNIRYQHFWKLPHQSIWQLYQEFDISSQ